MVSVTRADFLKALGVRGLKIFSGIVREEYLALLRDWQKASAVYREMADDVTVGTLLDAITTPLLAADFDVTPGGDAAADKEAAAFLWEAMTGMDRQTWRSHVSDMLECLQFGFALGEVVMEKRGDGRLWVKNIDPRGQETLHRWEWEGDKLLGFIQRHPVTGALLGPIPMGKTVHVAFRGRKGNPMGKPLLRSLFRPWRMLKYLENFESIGIERDVGGMPVVDFPDPDKWVGPTDLTQLKAIFEDAMKGLRMDEEAWLMVPPGSRVQPWAGGAKVYNVREAIAAKQKEILMRFFAQFLMLGMEQVGTQALVKGSHDFFSLALKSVQQELLEAWNLQLVPLVFEFNSFPGVTALPQITWHDPGKVDVAALLAAYVQAAQAQLVTPLRQDEEHVRALMDLPDLPEGEGEGPRTGQPGGGIPFPFQEGPPGPPPRPGLVWKPETHRWIKPSESAGTAKTLDTREAATQWGKQHYAEWSTSLSDSEFKALDEYSDFAYLAINRGLRKPPPPEELRGTIQAIDDALARSTVPETVVTWRGIRGIPAAQLPEGAMVTDNGFVSTSLNEFHARGMVSIGSMWQGGALVRVTIPRGTKGAYISEAFLSRNPEAGNEAEMLLPRGTQFRVTGHRADPEWPGQTIVEMERIA